MEFLITQVHDPENCPKDIGGFRKVFINEKVDGLALKNIYIEHGSHTILYVVETDNYEKIVSSSSPGC